MKYCPDRPALPPPPPRDRVLLPDRPARCVHWCDPARPLCALCRGRVPDCPGYRPE